MRLAGAFLFVVLTALPVLADEPKPADSKPEVTKRKVPFRVVTVLPETRQVLMFDKNTGGYVVAEVGMTLEGYRVDEIDDDEVTLLSENGNQIILAAPAKDLPPPPTAAATTAPAKPAAKSAAPKSEAPGVAKSETVDPYADGKPADAPVDPYADPEPPAAAGEGGVRVASANPADPYSDPTVAAFADAVGLTPSTNVRSADADAKTPDAKTPDAKTPDAKTPDAKTPDGAALAAAATGSSKPAGKAPPASSSVIARAELDAALADFSKLAGSFHAAFTAEGLRFDAINEGTLLAKAGLKKGDVVTAVDNQPLRSLDDAANLYARAGSVRNTTITVLRAGKPVSLRVTIQ